MDLCYWTQHVHPRTSPERWPAGKISSHVNVERVLSAVGGAQSSASPRNFFTGGVPPSVRKKTDELLAMTESDTWATKIPFVECDAALDSDVSLWTSVLAQIDHTCDAPCTDAPVSTSVHEDEQLCYSRDGIPLCALGSACAATWYPGHQGPLHIYLSASQQALHDSSSEPTVYRDKHATCLLCIRRDVHGARLGWQAMVPNPSMQVRRDAIVPAPFTNITNAAGGYKESAMAVGDSSSMFSNANIVGVTGLLRINYNPRRSAFFFDQTSIKVVPPGFLCQGRKPRLQ